MSENKPNKRVKLSKLRKLYESSLFKVLFSALLFILIGSSAAVLFYYSYYSRLIDRKLSGEVFKNTAEIYAAPYRIFPGQKLSMEEVVSRLQRAGFESSDKAGSADGTYAVNSTKITVKPQMGDAMRLEFQKNSLARIVKLKGGETSEAWLPAELVTNLFDESREKRRIVEFNDLPKFLVDALIAAEDQRFYRHWGIDPVRLVGAIVESVRDSDRVRGTSTITQQLARNFFLTPDRRLSRKLNEIFISLLLEQRLTKQQILTMYANEVYLGQRGSFSIHGFGEGAAAYFGKDLGALALPEAAMLAGIIPAPNGIFSPTKHPDEVKKRRNQILTTMHSLGMITDKELADAKKAELKVAPIKVDASDAPYLVDFVREELLKDFSEDALINNSL